MQQAHDFLKESKLLYELLNNRDESDFQLITQFKNWSINDVIGHLYLFNVAAIKTVDGPKSFDDFFMPFLKLLQKGQSMVQPHVPLFQANSLRQELMNLLHFQKVKLVLPFLELGHLLPQFLSHYQLDC